MSETKQISETYVAVNKETKNARDTWIAAKGASIFQSRHMNICLREQITYLLNEGNNIKANIWDLQDTMRTMKAELKRIKQAEEAITVLETDMEAVKKRQEEESETAFSEEEFLQKLEKDNENLHMRIFMLSEKSSALTASKNINQRNYLQLCCYVNKLQRELQECKLICGEEDEVFRKILQDREKTVQIELSAVEKEKARCHSNFPGKFLNLHPNNLMYEIARAQLEEKIRREEKPMKQQLCGGRWKLAWVFIILWHFAGILLVILLTVLLVILFVLGVCLSNHTVTEAYQRPLWRFLDYYIQPHIQLYSTGLLPK
ncbi:uncharacterized protein LOC117678832 isoform X4 [Pantherophis guttatus]|uniref:Uncharacterized protein LOC117678832 isoform X4 n=1 Tax=Pantherophis guttatus TaxID=94885 RepID=A0A6P9DK85_PANGU|nr:uncharacterized protein LOC117678832 isoform X4 [Pantherophis guttatus]